MYYCEANVAQSPPDGESTEVPTSSRIKIDALLLLWLEILKKNDNKNSCLLWSYQSRWTLH